VTIDTHHHRLPDFFWHGTDNAHAAVGGLAPHRWSTEAALSFMDDAGIDVAAVSVSTPGVHTRYSAKASVMPFLRLYHILTNGNLAMRRSPDATQ
jgi:6-methylsalicylate decarboxylase